jgi:hypothetical protein
LRRVTKDQPCKTETCLDLSGQVSGVLQRSYEEIPNKEAQSPFFPL